MEEDVKIPEERIAVLIGENGVVKRKIARETKTTITVDSHTGDVLLEGEGESFFVARDIVKAIGRDFSPERAFNLLKEGYLLKIIEIPEFTGKNASAQKARRGRVIGRRGEARKEIEKKTNSFISVHGKTVAIIAKVADLEKAIEAVKILLQGSSHETMENFLERKGKTRFEL
jgi:ribosomal RNA assembly protein